MSFDTDRGPERPVPVSRRRFIAAAAAAGVGSVAGCTDVSTQEFEAQPVGLPEDSREELVLAESGHDSSTVTREVDAVDGEVTITSYAATYARGLARGRPTLFEKYLGRVNGSDGAGPVTFVSRETVPIVTAGPFGIQDGENTDGLQGMYVPHGMFSKGGTDSQPGSTLVMGIFSSNAQIPLQDRSLIGVDANEFLPAPQTGRGFDSEFFDPIDRGWVPESADFLSEGTVVLAHDDDVGPEELFGVSAEEMPGEPIEGGDSLESLNPYFIAYPDPLIVEDIETTGDRYKNFLDAGTPSWVGGATFGFGVLSTPAAKVAGQSVNPLASMGFQELLTDERFSGNLIGPSRAGESNEVEWLAGPRPLAEVPWPSADRNPSPGNGGILDQEADLETFLGVVNDDDGPLGVGVDMARVEHDHEGGTDIVITTAVHTWPVGSGEYFDVDRSERFTGILGSILSEARTVTVASGEQLAPGTRLS